MMVDSDHSLIQDLLKTKFEIVVDQFESVWEACDWSETLKIIDNHGKSYFLKGTPRSRPEARITQLLHGYNPRIIPKIITADLLADHDWCWFLMESAGASDYNSLEPAVAIQAAFHLGQLQRQVIQDVHLPKLLPQSLPADYLAILHRLIIWLETHFPNQSRELIDRIGAKLLIRTRFFDSITDRLSSLSPSCVHSDLWSGNIAVSDKQICLLDWGDAIWGIGTTSIIDLLNSSDTPLPTDDLWDAYAKGWGQAISDDLRFASEIASNINALIVEQHLADLSNHETNVPIGIQSIIERLIELSD